MEIIREAEEDEIDQEESLTGTINKGNVILVWEISERKTKSLTLQVSYFMYKSRTAAQISPKTRVPGFVLPRLPLRLFPSIAGVGTLWSELANNMYNWKITVLQLCLWICAVNWCFCASLWEAVRVCHFCKIKKQQHEVRKISFKDIVVLSTDKMV